MRSAPLIEKNTDNLSGSEAEDGFAAHLVRYRPRHMAWEGYRW